jgi:hypothetical protein
MIIIPDACGFGILVVISRFINGVEHPLAYASRLLPTSEVNYSITEKKALRSPGIKYGCLDKRKWRNTE